MSKHEVGTCSYAGNNRLVYIPQDLIKRHTYLSGRPGAGKACIQKHLLLALNDVEQAMARTAAKGDLCTALRSGARQTIGRSCRKRYRSDEG